MIGIEDVNMVAAEQHAQPVNELRHKHFKAGSGLKDDDKKDSQDIEMNTPDVVEEQYEKQEKLGEGTYGVVHKCIEKVTGTTVAIKKIRLEHADEGIPSTAIREISLLQELDHPNIIQLKDIVHGEDQLFLIFEFLTLDMKKYLDKKGGPLPAPQVRHMMYQLL